jgi:hypothetical protein
MATDGPTPPDCDNEIMNDGTCVFVTHSISPNRMERWVKEVATLSGQRVDWHYCGGRACVLALGDLEKVALAMAELMPLHNELQEETARASKLHDQLRVNPPR